MSQRQVYDLSSRNAKRVFEVNNEAAQETDQTNQVQDQTNNEAEEVNNQTDEAQVLEEDPNADLRQRLAELSGSDDLQTRPELETTNQTEEPSPSREEPEIDLEAYSKFDTQLQQYFGINGDELKEGISFVRQFRQEQQLNSLRQEWGEGFESQFQAVRQRWEKLPQDMQMALDNIEGAKLIAAQIAMENQKAGQSPMFDRSKGSSVRAQQSQYKFTKSELEGLSNADYAKNAKIITDAYQRGLVDLLN